MQTEYDALIAALIAQVEADSGLPLLRVNCYDAVSYTHLDVYKRQYSVCTPRRSELPVTRVAAAASR